MSIESQWALINTINVTGGTSVTCYSCGCTSDNWGLTEDPWQRHARTSPSCRYVNAVKSPDYVKGVLEEHGPYKQDDTPVCIP